MKADGTTLVPLRTALPRIIAGSLVGMAVFVAMRKSNSPSAAEDKLPVLVLLFGCAVLQLIAMNVRLERRLRALEGRSATDSPESKDHPE